MPYLTVFYHTAIGEGDGSRPADGNYGLDAAGRSISIVCAIILAGITAPMHNNIGSLTLLSFLRPPVSSHGICSASAGGARLWPAHIRAGLHFHLFAPESFEQLTIAVVTWLVYGVPHWFNLVTMNSTPTIIIGVGMLGQSAWPSLCVHDGRIP